MLPYRAIASDGDGTLTERGVMDRKTLAALHRWIEWGGMLILVTGEETRQAKDFAHVRLFQRVVAENGAILFNPLSGQERLLCQPRPPGLLEAIQSHLDC